MVSLTRSQSLAVLAFCSGALAAPAPVEEKITLPIGKAPANYVADWVGPKIEYQTYTLSDIEGINDTIAPPSDNLVGRGLKSRGPIGEDDRELWTDTSYPYSTMGKIEWSNGVFW